MFLLHQELYRKNRLLYNSNRLEDYSQKHLMMLFSLRILQIQFLDRAGASPFHSPFLSCGCDEAGAGPLAGPVYAGAVVLPRGLELKYLNDSKQVTPKRRDHLFDQIREQAAAWAEAAAMEILRLSPLSTVSWGVAMAKRRPLSSTAAAGGRLT